jgi:hypothetical protein
LGVQIGGKMKITIGAGLFAIGDMKINTAIH